MKRLETCPSAEFVEKVLSGDASEDDVEALEAHLAECEQCSTRVRSLHENDAALEDDLHWAASVRASTYVSIGEPLSKLNELLPEYEIIREIGRGGMGIVYLAHQPKLNRQVAIKVLPALLGVIHPDSKARFRREAELAAGLDHTNIISIHDYGEAEGTLFYAMQYIRGRSLRNVLDEIEQSGAVDCVIPQQSGSRGSRTSPVGSAPRAGREYYVRVAHWIAEVADALHYAHKRGITHRDIKPSNLLLTEDGKLMISDFGLARLDGAQSITATRSLVGTCRYMAPEQLKPGAPDADHLVDIYALGATLYELLAFRPMFSGTDERTVIHQIGTREPTPPHRLAPSVPRELETICLKAVSKDPHERYASADDFANDLRRWTLGLPIEARRSPLPVRAYRMARRHKLTVGFSCLSLLCASAAGMMWVKYSNASRAELVARSDESVQRAQSLTHQARLAMDDEDYESAVVLLDDALSVFDGFHEAVHLKADALARQGHYETARQILRQAVARDDSDWRSRYQLGMLLHRGHNAFGRSRSDRMNSSGHGADDRTATIAGLLTEVERLHPGSPEVYALRSTLQNDHHESIRLLDEAIEIEPVFTDALVERAERFGCIGDYESALADLDAAIAARHGGHRVHGLRGIALYHLNRWAECEDAMSAAIGRNPLNMDWLYDRAIVRTYLGRFAGAIEDASQAIALDANYTEAYTARGRGYAGIGKYAQALADYDHAASLDPTMADIYVERGLIYWNMGDYERSLADANRLIELEPNQSRGYQRRAQTYLKLKQWDNALDDLAHCDEVDPTDFATPTIRGGVYYYSGRYAEAARSFKIGQQRRPNDYGNYSFHAVCLMRLGQYNAALVPLTEWVSLANNRDLGLMRRGMLYEMLDETELAIADYESAAKSPRLGLYPALWAGICRATRGDPDAAAIYFARCEKEVMADSWESKLLATVRGSLAPGQLVEAASTQGQLIEAYYYSGVAQQLRGDQTAGVLNFERAAEFGDIDILECDFALLRLRSAGNTTTRD